MKYIIDYITVFFQWLIDLFASVFELIWNVIQVILAGANFLFDVITSLPAILTIPATAIVICCVLYKVLGREGGEASS